MLLYKLSRIFLFETWKRLLVIFFDTRLYFINCSNEQDEDGYPANDIIISTAIRWGIQSNDCAVLFTPLQPLIEKVFAF